MKHLLYQKKDMIGILTIHRPETMNALNEEVLTEILHFLTLAAPYENLKALILTGSGDKAFIAGADIKEMQKMSGIRMQAFASLGQLVARTVETLPFITIAAVNGYALGGGMEMALACDFIFATNEAKLGLPEVSLGLIPGFGGTQRLLRAIGIRKAKELIYSGKIMTAKEALDLGIVSKVCAREALLTDCMDHLKAFLKNPFFALLQAKNAINSGNEMPIESALELEKSLCSLCFSDPEREEKMAQFLLKSEKKSKKKND